MKSEYGDRKTLGTLILETQEEHDKMHPVQAGELSEEIGKKCIMPRILDCVEQYNGYLPRLWIEVIIQKDPISPDRRYNILIRPSRYKPLMQPNQDIWFVDYIKQEFKHVWGLPSRSEFAMVLNNPSPDNKKNIGWINDYLKLERQAKKAG